MRFNIIADNTIKVNSYVPVSATLDYVQKSDSYRRHYNPVSSSNNVTAHYEVDGTEYSIHVEGFGVNDSRLKNGETITVYYDP